MIIRVLLNYRLGIGGAQIIAESQSSKVIQVLKRPNKGLTSAHKSERCIRERRPLSHTQYPFRPCDPNQIEHIGKFNYDSNLMKSRPGHY